MTGFDTRGRVTHIIRQLLNRSSANIVGRFTPYAKGLTGLSDDEVVFDQSEKRGRCASITKDLLSRVFYVTLHGADYLVKACRVPHQELQTKSRVNIWSI
jgi:hypothetical protein